MAAWVSPNVKKNSRILRKINSNRKDDRKIFITEIIFFSNINTFDIKFFDDEYKMKKIFFSF